MTYLFASQTLGISDMAGQPAWWSSELLWLIVGLGSLAIGLAIANLVMVARRSCRHDKSSETVHDPDAGPSHGSEEDDYVVVRRRNGAAAS